ncbi:MAG: hypothetical protein OEV81_13430 [Betaproteobacteria bacterium]|nr:hypothetical protein [Betaproteobacteria bacterium]MDH5222740.1 hypothetical protein [Betaproteobacteria bacterium]MDH5352555.1 hypothetical protein [Betaproteobacteria bacterium]
MRAPLIRDVPPRAAAVVVALTLAASLVTGAPWTTAPDPTAAPAAAPKTVQAPMPSGEPLDLEALERRKTSGTVPDLFVSPAPVVAPPPPVRVAAIAAPPPPPVAPPLPFRYLGRFDDGERQVVFLEEGQVAHSVGAGETIGQRYRVERISDTTVTFRHLLFGTEQTLVIPKTP